MLRNMLRPSGLQKAVFHALKDGLLRCVLRPFGLPFAAFRVFIRSPSMRNVRPAARQS